MQCLSNHVTNDAVQTFLLWQDQVLFLALHRDATQFQPFSANGEKTV
jgi:hypothetical protein